MEDKLEILLKDNKINQGRTIWGKVRWVMNMMSSKI